MKHILLALSIITLSSLSLAQLLPFAHWQKKSSPSTSGNFFVLSSAAYTGDLGGLDGADQLCLVDLKNQTWRDKDTVTLHGGTVQAWLCDGSGCQNLLPNTTYTYARSGSATAGGQTFTTNGSAQGPGDTTTWSAGTYFGLGTDIWSGRVSGSSTLWGTTNHSQHCLNWSSSGSSDNANRGVTSSTGNGRWGFGTLNCSSSGRLVCFVDDDGNSGDKTPNPVDWTNFALTSNTQTINGIDGRLGLKLVVTDLEGSPTFEYQLNSGSWLSFSSATDHEFGVESGDTLTFRFAANQIAGATAQIQIVNVSDGNSVIDTVTGSKGNFGHFFILSDTAMTGNLGGLSGANATCLTDLRSKSWKGKGGPAITTGTVKAWLCDGTTCNQTSANQTYSFAVMNNVAEGGETFVSNGSSQGPANSEGWWVSGYFNTSEYYWTGRSAGSATLWPNTSDGNHCNAWTDNTFSFQGKSGFSNNSGTGRWSVSNYMCSSARRYICVVSDDGSTDVTPTAMDWTDSIGISSSETFTNITAAVEIQISASYVSGAPTLEYRINAGAWVPFTPGSPANISVANNDTLEFRPTGTSTHSADLTVSNTTLGGVEIDELRITVP